MKKLTSLILIMLFSLTTVLNINVSAATYNAYDVVQHAEQLVGSKFSSGYCLRFVKECFRDTYGFTSSACCAYTYSKTYKDDTSMYNIPVGADVFFKGSGSTCSTCKNKAGHIGIYVGDGYCVHAMNGKVQKTKVSAIDNYSNLDYIGWGWHGNKTFTTNPNPVPDEKISWPATSGIKTYVKSTGNNTKVYKTATSTEKYGTIYASDLITIKGYSGSRLKVTYPIKGGTKTGYINISDVTSGKANVATSKWTATSKIITYRRSGGGTEFGYISRGDVCYTIATSGKWSQVIYPISGGYKMGWIKK